MRINLVNDNFKENYLENLLKARGVEDFEEYIKPSINCLQNPKHLKNIELGAIVYKRIVDNAGSILIIVDPDVDGFTSSAIIWQYTKRINPNCELNYYLHEGKAHGLEEHIEQILNDNKNYDLIIVPDAGSNDIVYHDKLNEINTPCLVIDHHIADLKFSDNAVIINNQTSPNYKNKDLTGAGVVYQFCKYCDEKFGLNFAEDFIDLAALGIIADMGSVLSLENRFLIKNGLSNIKNYFFQTLLLKQAYSITGNSIATTEDIQEKTNPISVAFYIVPLINAMIRVGTMAEKERLFLAFIDGKEKIESKKRGAKGQLEEIAVESARECGNAKAKQDRIKEQSVFQLERKIFDFNLLDNKILFVELDEEDSFPSELNGLIATQLVSKYKKPTIVARKGRDGIIKGSARGLSNSELNSFKQFMNHSGFFEFAQGHDNACGCAINSSKLSAFQLYANETLANIDFGEGVYEVNFVRKPTDYDLKELISELSKGTDLWGQGNPEPLIYVENILVSQDDIKIMGANEDTIKIEKNGVAYMKFKSKKFIEEIKNKESFILNLVGRANLNEWRGRKTPQIFIDDYEIIDEEII